MPPAATLAPLTITINKTGWDAVCRRMKLVGPAAIAGYIGVNTTTVYRVMSGALTPGPKFIAASTVRLGARFEELFVAIEDAA
jgi:hypothetical protein